MVRVALLKVFERADDSRRLLDSSSDDADDLSLFPDEGEYKPPPDLMDYGPLNPAEEERPENVETSKSTRRGSNKSIRDLKRSNRKLNNIPEPEESDHGAGGRKGTKQASSTEKTREKTARKMSTQRDGIKGKTPPVAGSLVHSKSERKLPERRLMRSDSDRLCLSRTSHDMRSPGGIPRKSHSSNSKTEPKGETASTKRPAPQRGLSRRGSTGNLLAEDPMPKTRSKGDEKSFSVGDLPLMQEHLSKTISKSDKAKGMEMPSASEKVSEKDRKRGMRRSSTGDMSPGRTGGCMDATEAVDESKKYGHGKLGSSSHGKLGSSSHGKLGSSNQGKLGSSSHGKLGSSSHSRRLSANKDHSQRSRRKSVKGFDSPNQSKRLAGSVPEESSLLPPSDDEDDEDPGRLSSKRQEPSVAEVSGLMPPSDNEGEEDTARPARTSGKPRRDRKTSIDEDDASFGL